MGNIINRVFESAGPDGKVRGTPQQIIDYIDAVGNRTFHSWRTSVGFARDTRNHALTPTAGTYQRIGLEATLPGSTVQYWKLDYQFSKFWPISPALVLNTAFNIGYGDSYGEEFTRNLCYTPPTAVDSNGDGVLDTEVPGAAPTVPCETTSPDYRKTVTASGLPFFENYYAGGVSPSGRVRGFVDNTLGPRVPNAYGYLQPLGGAAEVQFLGDRPEIAEMTQLHDSDSRALNGGYLSISVDRVAGLA